MKVLMDCPRCGGRASEYDKDKWACLRCQYKYVVTQEESSIVNQNFYSIETNDPITFFGCPFCKSEKTHKMSVEFFKKPPWASDGSVFGVLLLFLGLLFFLGFSIETFLLSFTCISIGLVLIIKFKNQWKKEHNFYIKKKKQYDDGYWVCDRCRKVFCP